MIIGVPKEIKIHEYRIGMTPASVRELTARGHTVLVETDAGKAIGFTDTQYSWIFISLGTPMIMLVSPQRVR